MGENGMHMNPENTAVYIVGNMSLDLCNKKNWFPFIIVLILFDMFGLKP
jgi:hypothetical protein